MLTPGLNYYIPDPVNPISSSAITVDISGMPSSTNPQTPTAARNSGNQNQIDYTMICDVPSTATSGTIAVSGAATIKPTLTWAALTGAGIAGGVLTPPNGEAIGAAYYWGPFDSATGRTATIVWDASLVSTT